MVVVAERVDGLGAAESPNDVVHHTVRGKHGEGQRENDNPADKVWQRRNGLYELFEFG